MMPRYKLEEPKVYVEDTEEPVTLPYKFEVCPQCEGRGTSCEHLGAYTASEWAEQDDDFKEDYMAGRFDRCCDTCGGKRVVPVVDADRCDAELLAAYHKQEADKHADRRTQYQEYLVCGGWREEYGY